MQLWWKVAEHHKKLVNYFTVRYLALSPPNEPERIVHSMVNDVLITGLKPFTWYEFSVRAHISEDVYGEFCPVKEVATTDKVPAAPVKLEFSPLDASTVTVSWKPAPVSQTASPNTPQPSMYEILYTQNRTLALPLWSKIVVLSSKHQVQVTGLVSNTEYWFRVRGCSEDERCGAYSEPLSVTIKAWLDQGAATSKQGNIYVLYGLVVTLCVMVTSAFIICCVIKARAGDRRSHRHFATDNGDRSHMNGLRYPNRGYSDVTTDISGPGLHEMEVYVPMLTQIPPDFNSGPLDAKGSCTDHKLVNGFHNYHCRHFIENKSYTNGDGVMKNSNDVTVTPAEDLVAQRHGAHVHQKDTDQPHGSMNSSPLKQEPDNYDMDEIRIETTIDSHRDFDEIVEENDCSADLQSSASNNERMTRDEEMDSKSLVLEDGIEVTFLDRSISNESDNSCPPFSSNLNPSAPCLSANCSSTPLLQPSATLESETNSSLESQGSSSIPSSSQDSCNSTSYAISRSCSSSTLTPLGVMTSDEAMVNSDAVRSPGDSLSRNNVPRSPKRETSSASSNSYSNCSSENSRHSSPGAIEDFTDLSQKYVDLLPDDIEINHLNGVIGDENAIRCSGQNGERQQSYSDLLTANNYNNNTSGGQQYSNNTSYDNLEFGVGGGGASLKHLVEPLAATAK